MWYELLTPQIGVPIDTQQPPLRPQLIEKPFANFEARAYLRRLSQIVYRGRDDPDLLYSLLHQISNETQKGPSRNYREPNHKNYPS